MRGKSKPLNSSRSSVQKRGSWEAEHCCPAFCLWRAGVATVSCPAFEEDASLPSGVLLIKFDGDSFHFCIFSQSIFASVVTEKGVSSHCPFTLSVHSSRKTPLKPKHPVGVLELQDTVWCMDVVKTVGSTMRSVSVRNWKCEFKC